MNGEKTTGWAIVAIIAALFFVALIPVIRDWDEIRPRTSGDPAPAFELPVIAADGSLGATVSLASLKGKVVLVDFWATWCGPCRASMPRLETISKELGPRGLELLSVNTEGPNKARSAREMADRLSPSATLVSDGGAVADSYGVTSIPHLALIDRRGVIRWVHSGGLTSSASRRLIEKIEALLAN